jgi:hypothetical protein
MTQTAIPSVGSDQMLLRTEFLSLAAYPSAG